MLETITAGLLLATVSGVTYLAYKHPHAYRRVGFPLSCSIVCIYLMLLLWGLGAQAAYDKLLPLIDISKWPQAGEALDAIQPRFWVISAASLGATTYLALLYWLPKLLEQEQKESPDEPSPQEKDKNV